MDRPVNMVTYKTSYIYLIPVFSDNRK